jgi:hypothetical protein
MTQSSPTVRPSRVPRLTLVARALGGPALVGVVAGALAASVVPSAVVTAVGTTD